MISQIEDLTTNDEHFILPQEEEEGETLYEEESLAHSSFNPNQIDLTEIKTLMKSQKQVHKNNMTLSTRRQKDAMPKQNRLGVSINEIDAARRQNQI